MCGTTESYPLKMKTNRKFTNQKISQISQSLQPSLEMITPYYVSTHIYET